MTELYFGPELEVLVLLWALVAVVGAAVSYVAIRAWRSHGERTLGFLAAGFLALSVGSSVTWFSLYLMGQNLWICESGSTGFMIAGFGMVLYAVGTRTG